MTMVLLCFHRCLFDIFTFPSALLLYGGVVKGKLDVLITCMVILSLTNLNSEVSLIILMLCISYYFI